MISGFFLKKKPPRTQLNRAHELENTSSGAARRGRRAVIAVDHYQVCIFACRNGSKVRFFAQPFCAASLAMWIASMGEKPASTSSSRLR
jgi:hypothetical protein